MALSLSERAHYKPLLIVGVCSVSFIPSVTLFLQNFFCARSFSELPHLQIVFAYVMGPLEHQIICSPLLGERGL